MCVTAKTRMFKFFKFTNLSSKLMIKHSNVGVGVGDQAPLPPKF